MKARNLKFKLNSRARISFILALLSLLSTSAILVKTEHHAEPTPYELKYPANFGGRFSIPADNPLTKEGVKLGRMLFYEELLSSNNKISCATCHKQNLAFTDNEKFSFGVDGTQTKRNSMSLANVLWVRNFFWDGRAEGLEAQSIVPLTDPHEMGQTLSVSSKKLQNTSNYPSLFKQAFGTDVISGDLIVKAIAQFERTLISSNSNYDKYLRGEYQLTTSELHGLELFSRGPQPTQNIRGANCGHCHGSPKTFIELFHNNGLDISPSDKGREDVTGQTIDRGRFRVATLRNIELTAPYMHDGRFNTLDEVLDHYSDHVKQSETLSPFISEVSNVQGKLGLQLTKQEKEDIISFLKMLTDHQFINNLEFSDPAASTK